MNNTEQEVISDSWCYQNCYPKWIDSLRKKYGDLPEEDLVDRFHSGEATRRRAEERSGLPTVTVELLRAMTDDELSAVFYEASTGNYYSDAELEMVQDEVEKRKGVLMDQRSDR